MHKNIKKMFEQLSHFSSLTLASIVLFLTILLIFSLSNNIIFFYVHPMKFKILLAITFSIISLLLIFITYKTAKKEAIEPPPSKIIEIFDLLEDEIAIIDAKTLTFTYLNQSLLKNTQYNKNELIGKSLNNLYSNYSPEQIQNFITPLINKEIDTVTCEITRRKKDDSTYFAWIKLKYFNDTNSIISISNYLAKGKEIEDIKAQFVSMINHELRTPLTNISGALKIILNGLVGQIPITMEEMLNLANSNAVRLLDSINELVDVEKIKKIS